jgi:hypothetical protein
MSTRLALPIIRVGESISHENLTIFPLFTTSDSGVGIDYVLSDEAMSSGAVVVEEISDSGSVPTLLVTNQGDHRVLFLEGEELRGAKQNRVLNTSLLIAARTKAAIPVSCVEQGRWHHRSRTFAPSGSHSSSKMRRVLKETVSRSLKDGQGHRSDQGTVWEEVTRLSESMVVPSKTMAMSDTYDQCQRQLEAFRNRLDYVEGASGLAVAIGPDLVAIDLFDKPATCRKVWNRLLSGFVMDALEAQIGRLPANAAEVEAAWKKLEFASWESAPAVGEGEEFRADVEGGTHASALTFESSVIHGSAVMGALS